MRVECGTEIQPNEAAVALTQLGSARSNQQDVCQLFRTSGLCESTFLLS